MRLDYEQRAPAGAAGPPIARRSLASRVSALAARADGSLLRLFCGPYWIILGMASLLLPESTLGVALQPRWLIGASLLVSGLSALWLAAVAVPRRRAIALTALAALPSLAMAVAYAQRGSLAPAAVLGFLALGLLAALAGVPGENPARRPDSLGLALGATAVVQGLELAARAGTSAGAAAVYGAAARPLGLALIAAGIGVLAAQLSGRAGPGVRRAAHAAAGLLVLGMQAAVVIAAGPLYAMIGAGTVLRGTLLAAALGAATVLRGAVLAAIPWASSRVARLDRTAYRLRVAVALVTAAVLPLGTVLPLILAVIPEDTGQRTIAQIIAYVCSIAAMLAAAVSGWWLAGQLAAPLGQLARGVNRIAAGQQATSLPEQQITELAELRQAVEQMALALVARGEERAALLESEQRARAAAEQAAGRLELAHARAQEAVRVRDAFLSVAAHELRNPLTALMGNAQLVARRAAQDGTLSERNQRLLQSIVDQSGRLNELIGTMLDASRLEVGQLQIDAAPLDAAAVARRVVDELAPALTTHRLAHDLPAGPLLVSGDELRLAQALQNLVGNAVKYSPPGTAVTVRAAAEGGSVRIEVADEGIGIPAESLPKLFQPYFRAPNALRQSVSGLGVGLYVVREVVTLHGGEVTVTSAEGRGSTFTIRLPLLAE